MTDPLVSILVPTESRPEFLPWIVHVLNQTTYPRVEAVVVDSTPDEETYVDPITGFEGSYEAWYHRCFAQDQAHIRINHSPAEPGDPIGMKMRQAMLMARGTLFVGYGDDDWQHPDRIRQAVELFHQRPELQLVSHRYARFLDLEVGATLDYTTPDRPLTATLALIRRELAQKAERDDGKTASDTRWMKALLSHQPAWAWAPSPRPAAIWLTHGRNLNQDRRDKLRRKRGWKTFMPHRALGEAGAQALAALQTRLCARSD